MAIWRRIALLASVSCAMLSIVLWGISYINLWFFDNPRSGVFFFVELHGGLLHFDLVLANMVQLRLEPRQFEVRGFQGWQTIWWPQYGSRLFHWSGINHGCDLPLWLPLAACLVFPVYLLTPFHRRRVRQRRRHLCLACGYDLRGSTERCPECGRLIEVWQHVWRDA
jgi:hypothetical protein